MGHSFSFFRAGGFNQVRLATGADLLNLDQLDQKLWVALACPVQGLVFDQRTLELIDSDGDGRIRANELIAAIKWAGSLLKDADLLIQAPEELALDAIVEDAPEGQAILQAARTVLQGLGKGEATSIAVADSMAALQAFHNMPFNGDGVITAAATADAALQALIADVQATVGGADDSSGQPGVTAAQVAEFAEAVQAWLAWHEQGQGNPELMPLQENTAAAFAALQAVARKIDDFFVRVRLAVFDARAVAALNREEKEYYALAAQDLDLSCDEIRRLPLALVDAGVALPLRRGINPAWTAAMEAFVAKVVQPLLGDIEQLDEAQWQTLKGKLAAFEAWESSKAGSVVEALGLERLRAVAAGNPVAALAPLFAQEDAQASTASAIAALERLLRYVRDLYRLTRNFVNFQQFYQHDQPAIFQVGTLYLDQRATELCLRVEDAGKHAAMAPLSRAYLAYCDCTRKASGESMTIAAAFTNGDADNLLVGRNGIFYDREGRDWDATVTKLVENPISLREAFWSPYKKLVRFIEDQVAKRAAASEAEADSMLADTAGKVGSAATTGSAEGIAPKKIDVGVVAALGVAVGGITAALGALLQTFFGLGIWMPLGVVGLVLVISGPAMLVAWLKLRQRNMGPLLDANGWALNANARINVPFGAALTRVAALPPGSKLDLVDPFAEKRRPWKTWLFLLVAAAAAGYWAVQQLV
jgi:hypothetical protein